MAQYSVMLGTNWRYDDGREGGYDENFDMLIRGATVYERPEKTLKIYISCHFQSG